MNNYVIRHQNGGYLCYKENRWERTSRIDRAAQMSYEKACNVLENSISRNLRPYWEIVNVESIDAVSIPAADSACTGYDWEEFSKSQRSLFGGLLDYRERLQDEHQEIEMEICDIYHYIEFFSLDAARGYKAYKMLRERLQRRRFLKDELAKTNCVLNGNSMDFTSGKIDHAIRGFDSRRYSPRVLNELFG